MVAGQVEGEARVAAALDACGLGEHVRGGLRRRTGELVAHLDQHLAQAAGLALVGVTDGPGAALNGAHDAGRALRGLAALDRPRAVGLVRPGTAARLRQVVGEVVGGARFVGAVHRRDWLVGQRLARVVRGDLRGVPVGDLAVEDAGDRGRRQLQVGDAGQVVDHRDRGDVRGDLDHAAPAALLRLRELFLLEVGVAAGEGHATGDELGAAGARAARVVVDRGVGVRAREAGDPGLHGGLLRARAGTGDRPGEGWAARRGTAAAACGCLLVGRTAAGEQDASSDAGTGAVPQGLHARFLRGFRGPRTRCRTRWPERQVHKAVPGRPHGENVCAPGGRNSLCR